MTSLMKPSIFDEMISLREAVNNLFDNSFLSPTWSSPVGTQKQPLSALNVYEDNGHYYVMGLFPGLDPDKIDLSVKENVLTIRGAYNLGTWPQPATVQSANGNGHKEPESQFRTLLSEIPEGEFYRQIQLPAAFEFDKVEAYYDQGVLKLVLPKTERSQAKRITVQSMRQIAGNKVEQPQLAGSTK